ncbi:MAG: hypothetical protein AAGI37_12310 [Planctomycetota bacterium]
MGNVTVVAAEGLGVTEPLAPTNSTTFIESEFANWKGDDDLLVSFFLRSDLLGLPPIGSWSGGAANADFFDFTVIKGRLIEVSDPTSLALLLPGLGLMVSVCFRGSLNTPGRNNDLPSPPSTPTTTAW